MSDLSTGQEPLQTTSRRLLCARNWAAKRGTHDEDAERDEFEDENAKRDEVLDLQGVEDIS